MPGQITSHWEDPSSSSTWDAHWASQKPSCTPLHPAVSPCIPQHPHVSHFIPLHPPATPAPPVPPHQPCSPVLVRGGACPRAHCKGLHPARAVRACACACACVCVCVYREACLHMKVAVCSGGLYHLLYDLIWRVPQPPFPTLCMLCCQGPGLSLSALPGLSRQAVIP